MLKKAFESKSVKPTVKSGYKSVLFGGCFSHTGTKKLEVIKGKFKSCD